MMSFIRILNTLFFLLALVLIVGCKSKADKPPCPTPGEEPISACRAEEKCKQKKTSYGVGLGLGIGSNLGVGVGQSQNTENYTRCIDKDLADQQAMHEAAQGKKTIEGQK